MSKNIEELFMIEDYTKALLLSAQNQFQEDNARKIQNNIDKQKENLYVN